MRTVDTGFDPRNVMTMRMSLIGPQFTTTTVLDRLVRSGEESIRSIPGVMSVGASFGLPLEDDLGLRFAISGRPLVGSYIFASSLTIVDLPAPFSPTIATTEPAGSSTSTSTRSV